MVVVFLLGVENFVLFHFLVIQSLQISLSLFCRPLATLNTVVWTFQTCFKFHFVFVSLSPGSLQHRQLLLLGHVVSGSFPDRLEHGPDLRPSELGGRGRYLFRGESGGRGQVKSGV